MQTSYLAVPFLFLLIGCNAEVVEVTQAVEVPKTQLEARLSAAMAIEDESTQERAVVKCAKDAAIGGEVEVVLSGISAMKNLSLSDNLCVECCKEFADRGDIESATEVAQRIHDVSRRDSVLNGLAWDGEVK